MAACGPGNPCKGNNECCSNDNRCSYTYLACNSNSQFNLCGPCTTRYCFDTYLSYDVAYLGAVRCPQQVHAFKDCKFTKSDCINNRTIITIISEPIIGGSLSGNSCPVNLIETCNNCSITDWTACINRTRTRTRTQAINVGTACTLEENALPETQSCNDCIVSDWTPCINRTRIKSTIPPTNGGRTCPDPSSLIQTCNNCIFSDWTACTVSARTRKRTQSINSTACTFEENALPETQSCNDCIVSDWIGACINRTRIKSTIPPTNGGRTCPDPSSLIQTCNNCISEWTTCDGTNRIRTRTQSINSPACTSEENALPLTQSCNHCIISDWTQCNGTDKIKTRKRTDATNGGTACTPEENKLLLNEDCYNCKIGQWANWSVWSACDCKTKTITRTKKVINNNLNCNLIETQNCSNDEKCLKLECKSQNKYYNLQTKKCDNKNIFNYIINLFNLIILFIMNLFKFS
jgi:hypothetical protein